MFSSSQLDQNFMSERGVSQVKASLTKSTCAELEVVFDKARMNRG